MKRREFLSLVGSALTGMAVVPATAMIPRPPILPELAAPPRSWLTAEELCDVNACLDVFNAMAFAWHSEAFPEHRAHYRAKGIAAARRYMELHR